MKIVMTAEAERVLTDLTKGKKSDPAKARKVRKTIGFLADDPGHPSLSTHRYENYDDTFGRKIWQSNVESGTPSAWRVWWFYGPAHDEITVVAVGPHP